MKAQNTNSEPTDRYWAGDMADDVVDYLAKRRSSYFNYLYGSSIFQKVARNWCYYNNLYFGEGDDVFSQAIQRGGEEGEQALVSVNHFRSILHLMHTYIVQNRPAWDTKAINSDYRSMQQAKLGNDILDYYMDQRGVEEYYRRAIEESLIFGAGFVKITWDDQQGDEVAGNMDTLQIVRSGDLLFENPTIFDVAFDYTARRWEDSQWVMVRTLRNKWDLVEQYPAAREDILGVSEEDNYDFHDFRREQFARMGNDADWTDLIDCWEFYHDRTAALSEGRYIFYVGDVPLVDQPLQYKRKPIYRVVPGPMLLTPFGYTPAFDLQGPQEALNSEISTIVTNHKNLGPSKIWTKYGEPINMADLEPGQNLIQTETKPEVLNFAQTPREFFEFQKELRAHMEMISGVNAVARGVPQDSLRSGTALAIVDQKAVQYASVHQANAYRLLCEMGTGMLEILRQKATTPRVIYVAGVNNRSALREFQAQDLENISRVSVQIGNPLAKTTAGRKEIATELLTAQLIKTPEEYLSVLQTGQLRPMTEANDAQLTTCQDENERLRNGEPVAALVTDNHVFHVLKHQSILDSTEMRFHPIIAPAVLGHIKEHIAMLVDPEVQWHMMVLGYPIPLPPVAQEQMPQGGEGEAAPGGQPEEENSNLPQNVEPEAQDEAKSASMESAPVR